MHLAHFGNKTNSLFWKYNKIAHFGKGPQTVTSFHLSYFIPIMMIFYGRAVVSIK